MLLNQNGFIVVAAFFAPLFVPHENEYSVD